MNCPVAASFHSSDNSKKQKRRAKRERARMLEVNDALDTLRKCISPEGIDNKKLSKIETLRMARNYIQSLQKLLDTNEQPSKLEYARMLTNGLSQTTTNKVATMLQVKPCDLSPVALNPESATSSNSHSVLPQYSYSLSHPSAAPLQVSDNWQQNGTRFYKFDRFGYYSNH